jgi:NAD(P)-dependent dehydrogenase (short-subunit alcohol dehydrogenase family)
VRHLAERLAGAPGRLDVLMHNAGALLTEYTVTAQGHEATVAVHLLGPYLLTECLIDRLADSVPSRVITVTSGGLYTQRFDLAELEMGPEHYDGTVAYARAKRAQVVLTAEWQRRYGPRGIAFHAVHPGWADTPGLAEGLPGFARMMGPILRSPEEGADTAVWLAGAPAGQPPGGHLWLDRRPRSPYRLPWTVTPAADREAEGRALWEWCRERTAA